MLDINWSDVEAILQLIAPYLIFIGIFIAAVVILQIAVMKVKNPAKFLIRCLSFVAAAVAVTSAVALMLTGPLNTILTLASGSGTISPETAATSEELGQRIAEEGIVLQKNDANLLPLTEI